MSGKRYTDEFKSEAAKTEERDILKEAAAYFAKLSG